MFSIAGCCVFRVLNLSCFYFLAGFYLILERKTFFAFFRAHEVMKNEKEEKKCKWKSRPELKKETFFTIHFEWKLKWKPKWKLKWKRKHTKQSTCYSLINMFRRNFYREVWNHLLYIFHGHFDRAQSMLLLFFSSEKNWAFLPETQIMTRYFLSTILPIHLWFKTIKFIFFFTMLAKCKNPAKPIASTRKVFRFQHTQSCLMISMLSVIIVVWFWKVSAALASWFDKLGLANKLKNNHFCT